MEKLKKTVFLKSRNAAILVCTVSVILLAVSVFGLLLFVSERKIVLLIIGCVSLSCAIVAAVVCIYIFFLIVEIDENQIIVRSLFKVKEICMLSEIETVFVKTFWKEGKMIVFAKTAQISQPNFEYSKDCIKFQYCAKNLELLKNFWKGDIKDLPSDISG